MPGRSRRRQPRRHTLRCTRGERADRRSIARVVGARTVAAIARYAADVSGSAFRAGAATTIDVGLVAVRDAVRARRCQTLAILADAGSAIRAGRALALETRLT